MESRILWVYQPNTISLLSHQEELIVTDKLGFREGMSTANMLP
jgi:hypothetical protein